MNPGWARSQHGHPGPWLEPLPPFSHFPPPLGFHWREEVWKLCCSLPILIPIPSNPRGCRTHFPKAKHSRVTACPVRAKVSTGNLALMLGGNCLASATGKTPLRGPGDTQMPPGGSQRAEGPTRRLPNPFVCLGEGTEVLFSFLDGSC